MALARLVMKNLEQRALSSGGGSLQKQYQYKRLSDKINNNEKLVARFSSGVGDKVKSEGSSEVAVSEGNNNSKKSRLLPKRRGRRWLSRNLDRDFSPTPFGLFPPSLGNALMQATENMNKLFENMNLTPWSLTGRVRESDNHYKLKYDMPGIPKENVNITIGDGVLTIKGEHKEEKGDDDDDDDNNEYWSSYGYYNTSMVLPDDAKVDEIKAELKDGVLVVTIPRSEKVKEDVKHVNVE
ncbi:26.5 kDa heat shock protein, mitochondrial [Vicia villosa]|uniref:26.5 kDa heat shock protein, mitochondrial n=1 Tax=Vicia villosa TaxID=3911 RepID=UPI00273C972E|nr:26.5 kDa heat shock protein, mitochondrial [Vicia villosa]